MSYYGDYNEGFKGDLVQPSQSSSSRTRVTSLNGLTGPVILVDEDGNELPTNDATGTITVTGGGGAGAFAVGNTVFVDAAEGDDSTGTRERFDKPFLTMTAGIAAMSAGDLLVVRPGIYAETFTPKQQAFEISAVARSSNVVTVTTSTAHGLSAGNRVFHSNIDSAVSPATTFDGEFLVASATSVTYTIAQFGTNESFSGVGGVGAAIFFYHFMDGAFVKPAAGSVAIDFDQSGSAGFAAAYVSGSGSFFSTNSATIGAGSNALLYWEGRVMRMLSTDGALYACVTVSGFTKLRIKASESIISDSYDAVYGNFGPDAYIFAPLILGGNNGTNSGANGIECFPPENSTHQAVIEAGRVASSVGEAIKIVSLGTRSGRIIIRCGAVAGYTAGVRCGPGADTGTITDITADLITASNGQGVLDDSTEANVVRIHGARIESTYNNAAGYAVKKTGSTATLVLDNCTLVPHATANESINSGGAARTVTCFGSKTAYALGTNVTAPGILIDAEVK